MRIQSNFRMLVTVGVLAIGAAGLALADHGSSGGKSGSSSTTTEIRLKTNLTGPAIAGVTPKGEAEFRAIPSRNRSSLKVEAEHVNLPSGTVLTVVLQSGVVSTNIGTMTLNSFGEAELDLDSQDGDTVPAVQKGDKVSVTDGAATTYLIGIF